MKWMILAFLSLSLTALAQDPNAYLGAFDAKIYSLKSKGVQDFVVEIESSKLTKQMNDQMIFGKVEHLIFKVYWTAKPERLAIEIHGLPEGFKEIKEELKASLFSQMDNLIPQTTPQRFGGYKFSTLKPKHVVAQDTTGIAPVPSYVLKFDEEDKLIEIQGNKPVGQLSIIPTYEKESFSDGKWVLTSLVTTQSENGQTLVAKKDLDYGTHQGIGVLEEVKLTTEQKWESSEAKPVILVETLEFKNYKINTGDAMKFFLADPNKVTR